ncbi:T9SS type A sorting domain-containing protein, partial [Candidatus Margulisiibacteriota bacterium]
TALFTVNGAASPNISGISVSSGNRGTTGVTLTGTNFGANPGTVDFDALSATIESWDAGGTSITFTVPYNAERKLFALTMTTSTDAASQTSNSVGFTVNPTSTVITTPNGADLGVTAEVTIDGTNTVFMPGITAGDLDFGTGIVVNSVTYYGPTQITAEVAVSASTQGGARPISVVSSMYGGEVYMGSFTVSGTPTGEPEEYEGEGGVMKAYPNPFNPRVDTLYLPISVEAGSATIYIFDTTGRMIWKNVVTGLTAGGNQPTWDGRSGFGDIVENGLYLVRVIQNGKLIAKGKILVIKK